MGDHRPPLAGREDPIATRGRVVVADDDVLLREGLVRLLSRFGFDVVGQAGDGTRLLQLVDEHEPELAIIDTRMPPTCTTEGIQAAQAIRRRFPEIGILVLSAYIEVDLAMELMSSGDRIGYLLKSGVTDVSEFVGTIERIATGGSVVDPALVRELVALGPREDPLTALTEYERDILALMAEGWSNTGIAEKLSTDGETVNENVHGITGKLCLPETDAEHRRALAVLAYLEAR